MTRAWKAAAATLGACALGLAAFTAAGSGDGAGGPASAYAEAYPAPQTIAGAELQRTLRQRLEMLGKAAPSLGGANRKPGGRRARLQIKYYVGVEFQPVPPGGAQLFEIRCPDQGEQPLTGGMLAHTPGLVEVNSSRTNPIADFPTRPRAWYEAVFNITGATLEWKPFLTCGRGG